MSTNNIKLDLATKKKKNLQMNPVIVMLIIVLIAFALTYFMSSGSYEREKKNVIPGSFQLIDKEISINQFLGLTSPLEGQAQAVSLPQLFSAIPQGIVKQAPLIFMVLFIGGMFGILNKTGAIENGLSRLLFVTKGNIYVLVPFLMIVFSMGSTFMGLAKEYLLVIPMVIALVRRIGLPDMIGLAIVAIAVKVGYLASITNPFALSIAQPLVGLPVFSGLSMRIITYLLFIIIGIAFVFFTISKCKTSPLNKEIILEDDGFRLPIRQLLMLCSVAIGIIVLVYASTRWQWKNNDLSAYYLFLSVILASISGLTASQAADAFVSGMKKVMIAGVLIGLATAVSIILEQGQILDTIIYNLVSLVGDRGPYFSAYTMFISQLLLDIAIPSTSGQAAVTMPILGPIGELSGVSAQTTVFAFLMGNGLTNMITPTSSGLLIFLATAGISWTSWAKYILPLFIIYMIGAFALLSIAVFIGY